MVGKYAYMVVTRLLGIVFQVMERIMDSYYF